jgi:hypothetical protein
MGFPLIATDSSGERTWRIDFRSSTLVRIYGYTLGYRHQFAPISADYAKLQMVMGLAGPLITLNFVY